MTAASVGLLAAPRSKRSTTLHDRGCAAAVEASSGWTIGADASVAVVNVGANAQIDLAEPQQPVIGFVLTKCGIDGEPEHGRDPDRAFEP